MVSAVAGLRGQFCPERLSENAKSIKITLFAEILTFISSYLCSVIAKMVNKNIKTHYILNKNATLTPYLCDFYDFPQFSRKFVVRIYVTVPMLLCLCCGVKLCYGINLCNGVHPCYGVVVLACVMMLTHVMAPTRVIVLFHVMELWY